MDNNKQITALENALKRPTTIDSIERHIINALRSNLLGYYQDSQWFLEEALHEIKNKHETTNQ